MLKMVTEEVEGVSRQCRAALDLLREQISSVNASLGYLDWVSPAASNFSADMRACTGHILSLVEEGERLFGRVDCEVATWESMSSSLSTLTVNANFLSAISGGGLAITSAVNFTNLPIADTLITIFRGLVNRLPPWLQSEISKRFSGLYQTVLPETQSTGHIPKAWLEPLPDQEPQTQLGKLSSQPPDTVSSSVQVPVKSQLGLKYNGNPTGYGCVPTSASMVTDYWHQRDSSNPTISAQDLLNQNANQIDSVGKHEFTGTGMKISDLGNDLEPLGYNANTIMGTAENSADQIEALKKAVSAGPVVAVVRVGLKSEGYSHAVVVTGFNNNNTVNYNDPLTGSTHNVTVNDFDESWGSNFGEGYATRAYTTIQPAK